VASSLYLLFRRVLAVGAAVGSREFKELEIVVLRHELAVLSRRFAPEELAASLVITLFGNLDEPPVVNVCRGDVGEAETFALARRAGRANRADPTSTASRSGSYRETKRYLAGVPFCSREILPLRGTTFATVPCADVGRRQRCGVDDRHPWRPSGTLRSCRFAGSMI
jgi:hypothetical protein